MPLTFLFMLWSAILLQEPDAVAALLMQDKCMSMLASANAVHSDSSVESSPLQDNGADIDVTTLLLPEPGLAADAALLSVPDPSTGPTSPSHVQLEPGHSADPAAQSLGAPSSTLAAAAGADEADEGFREDLAEAGKVCT